jgi:hypothetical protein
MSYRSSANAAAAIRFGNLADPIFRRRQARLVRGFQSSLVGLPSGRECLLASRHNSPKKKEEPKKTMMTKREMTKSETDIAPSSNWTCSFSVVCYSGSDQGDLLASSPWGLRRASRRSFNSTPAAH